MRVVEQHVEVEVAPPQLRAGRSPCRGRHDRRRVAQAARERAIRSAGSLRGARWWRRESLRRSRYSGRPCSIQRRASSTAWISPRGGGIGDLRLSGSEAQLAERAGCQRCPPAWCSSVGAGSRGRRGCAAQLRENGVKTVCGRPAFVRSSHRSEAIATPGCSVSLPRSLEGGCDSRIAGATKPAELLAGMDGRCPDLAREARQHLLGAAPPDPERAAKARPALAEGVERLQQEPGASRTSQSGREGGCRPGRRRATRPPGLPGLRRRRARGDHARADRAGTTGWSEPYSGYAPQRRVLSHAAALRGAGGRAHVEVNGHRAVPGQRADQLVGAGASAICALGPRRGNRRTHRGVSAITVVTGPLTLPRLSVVGDREVVQLAVGRLQFKGDDVGGDRGARELEGDAVIDRAHAHRANARSAAVGVESRGRRRSRPPRAGG